MSKTIQYTLRMIANHKSWFGGLCLYPAQSLVRHGNRALTVNNAFLPLVVCFLLFFVIPDSVCLANNPYINKVYEFRPAPGQFTNVHPKFETGDTEESIRAKAEAAILDPTESNLISLGAWGGYVVFGFDHPIANVSGQKDLRIYGNAGDNGAEPGVIYVSYDANHNGLPDDKWYEIAGSEFGKPNTYRDYRMTYYRPTTHDPKPDAQQQQSDTIYIRWEDNKGNSGYLYKNTYHTQDYFPMWVSGNEMVFTGTKLPNNAIATPHEGKPTTYTLPQFDFGYADNAKATDADGESINIDWAVDENGQPVHLNGIHFVKVQNGLYQQCGWIGETSTEVKGAEDLHPDVVPTGIEEIATSSNAQTVKRLINGQICIVRPDGTYNVFGTKIQ